MEMEVEAGAVVDKGADGGGGDGADHPEPTRELAKTIAAIDRTTVHQICSGQVVLNLATAVKELLENSIDAGATKVEIRLKDHGATLIEVEDNGSGVESRNFEGLTLKHHTSKIREFEDLVGVETFGFRGEALSSLCALSHVSISTRHKESSTGSTISYDHNGKITKMEKSARPIGTTVSLKEIFSTMPVRHKEFLRNVKREFNKLCKVLNAYCLVSTGVRITCTNTSGKGKKSIVMSTLGSDKTKDNIISVFGTKQFGSLREVSTPVLTEEELKEIGLKFKPPNVTLTGFVSTCAHGEGRGSADRQFYFVNSRPCDPTKISKTVNEVYHSYNRHQFPFVYLNLVTSREGVDVNITPDKRQVFLQNEKYLCTLIRKSLENIYESVPCSIPLNSFLKSVPGGNTLGENNENRPDNDQSQQVDMLGSTRQVVSLASLKRKFSADLHSCSTTGQASKRPTIIQPKLHSFFRPAARVSEEINFAEEEGGHDDIKKSINDVDEVKITFENTAPESLQFRHLEKKSQELVSSQVIQDLPETGVRMTFDNLSPPRQTASSLNAGVKITFENSPPRLKESRCMDFPAGLKVTFDNPPISPEARNSRCKPSSLHNEDAGVKVTFENPPICQEARSSILNRGSIHDADAGVKITFENPPQPSYPQYQKSSTIADVKITFENPTETSSAAHEAESSCDIIDKNTDDPGPNNHLKKIKKIKFSLGALSKQLAKTRLNPKDVTAEQDLKFSAKISPTENATAEKELQRQINKKDFREMKIFGQFNLGFIIVGLNQDLFVVDQHATDEKYNFETLQKNYVINSQAMVVPQFLELTSANESLLMDNLPVFEKNGFKFSVDEEAPPSQRVKLTSIPISKNWTFGKEDIDEMLFLLSEGIEGSVTRPSRVRAMFASRACRSSVMIGKHLAYSDMRRLVDHMGQIEQPWNCPHGRPTIRHLVNINLMK